jgi:hypothetical protein
MMDSVLMMVVMVVMEASCPCWDAGKDFGRDRGTRDAKDNWGGNQDDGLKWHIVFLSQTAWHWRNAILSPEASFPIFPFWTSRSPSEAQLIIARVAPPGARGTGPRLRQSGYLTGIGVAEVLAGELPRIAGVMTLLWVGGPCGCAGHQGCTEKSENDLTHGFLLF